MLSSQKDLTTLQSGVEPFVNTDTTYSFEFSGLIAGNCYTLKVESLRDCNTTDLSSTATSANYTGDPATLSACTSQAIYTLTHNWLYM